MKRAVGAILSASIVLGGCATGHSAPSSHDPAAYKVTYITRHMQKLDGDDPSLNDAGVAAAEHLATILADKGISAIFATSTRRAMETAAPLARRTGVPITPYDPRNPQALVQAAAATRGAVLVVGHSNTVHDLVARFGARTPPSPLTEQDYGAVFAIDAKGGVEVIELGR